MSWVQLFFSFFVAGATKNTEIQTFVKLQIVHPKSCLESHI